MSEPGYSSAAVSRPALAVAGAFAVAALAAAAIDGQWWVGVAAAVTFLLVGAQLGVVRLIVSRDEVRAGRGPWGGGRRIPAGEVARAEAAELGFGQVLGVGLPTGAKPGRPAPASPTSRFTVRPGSTLLLVLGSGERIWISAADAPAAARALRSGADT